MLLSRVVRKHDTRFLRFNEPLVFYSNPPQTRSTLVLLALLKLSYIINFWPSSRFNSHFRVLRFYSSLFQIAGNVSAKPNCITWFRSCCTYYLISRSNCKPLSFASLSFDVPIAIPIVIPIGIPNATSDVFPELDPKELPKTIPITIPIANQVLR